MKTSINYSNLFLNISMKIKENSALLKNSEIKYKENNLDGVHVILRSSGKRIAQPLINKITCIVFHIVPA